MVKRLVAVNNFKPALRLYLAVRKCLALRLDTKLQPQHKASFVRITSAYLLNVLDKECKAGSRMHADCPYRDEA